MGGFQALLAFAIGVPVAGVAVRITAAHFALAAARKKIAADVEQFKKDNVYIGPAADSFRMPARDFADKTDAARDLRDETMAEMRTRKIVKPELELYMLNQNGERIDKKALMKLILKKNHYHKLKHLFRNELKHRIHLKRGVMGAAAGAAATQLDDAWQSLSDAYENIEQHAEPHYDMLEKKLIAVLDEFGLIDEAVEVIMAAQEFLKAHLGESVAQAVNEIGDWAGNFDAVPSSMSNVRSVWREFVLVMEDGTSVEDAIKNGGMTVFSKTIGFKTGAAIDAMFGGMTLGAFTILCSFAAAFARNKFLEAENKELVEQLEALNAEIEALYNKTRDAINKVTAEFEEEFGERIDASPDINDEPAVKEWIESLLASYSNGLQDAETQLTANTAAAIAALPENTALDRILGIDRRAAQAQLYLDAQRNLTSKHEGIVHHFSLAAEEHVSDALRFLIKSPIFTTAETEACLGRVSRVAANSIDSHAAKFNAWRDETNTFWDVGSKRVNDFNSQQAGAYNAVLAVRKPEMQGIAKKIRANNSRLGYKQPKAA